MANSFQLQYCTDERVAAYAKKRDITPVQAMAELLGMGIYPERFKRNIGVLPVKSQIRLLDLPIFVAGCGGLGGEIAANLAQLGAGRLFLCDFDIFEESNLNRQRYCYEKSLGLPKAEITAKALAAKSPWGEFVPVRQKITPDNPPKELAECALLIDCLDSAQGKLMLEEMARKNGMAWLFGAVLEHEGFACLRNSPNGVLAALYGPENQQTGAGAVLSHVVAGTATLMCSLLVKWLGNPFLASPLLHVDFSIPELETISLE